VDGGDSDIDCKLFAKKKGCLKKAVCRWNGKQDVCIARDAPAATNAPTNPPLDEGGENPTTSDCSAIAKKSPCKADSACRWHGKENVCISLVSATEAPVTDGDSDIDCSVFAKKKSCKKNAVCRWNGKQDVCIAR
jgi:hypothetical protein